MLVLLALLALSAMLYIGRLGFYSDDWSFLYTMQTKAEPSVWASMGRFIREDLPTRPGQAILLVALFRAYGLSPAPYHVFNTLVMALVVVLFYLALRRVGVARLFAFPAAALYALLPQYSTDRFWIAAFQAPLSIALYLASLLCGLEATERNSSLWGMAALAALTGSVLSYEVAVPLMLLNAWLWWRHGGMPGRSRPVRLVSLSLLLVVALSIYKALLTNRMEHSNGWAGYLKWLAKTAITPFHTREHGGLNVYFAVFTNYVQDGLLLPWAVWRVAVSADAADLWPAALVSLLAGAVLFFATYALARSSDSAAWRQARFVALSGLGVFALGYAIFLTNGNVQFSPTGIANRTAIAAALGVMLSLAGAAALATRWFRSAWRPWVYSLPIGLMGACGCFVLNGLSTDWAEAYQKQARVLRAVAAVSPDSPPGGTVLLDGVCPYTGAAPVFESSWDFSGALSLFYKTPTYLRGDIVSSRLAARADGFHVVHYLGEEHFYPYAEDLVIFRATDRTLHRIPNRDAAESYLKRPANANCPESMPGIGVTIF